MVFVRLFQYFLQLLFGAFDEILHRGFLYAGVGGYLADCHIVIILQPDYQPLLRLQAEHGGFDIKRARACLIEIFAVRKPENIIDVIRSTQPLALQLVERGIFDYFAQPGVAVCAAAELLCIARNFYKAVVQDVFGVILVAHNALRNRQQPASDKVIKPRERGAVTLGDLQDIGVYRRPVLIGKGKKNKKQKSGLPKFLATL